MAASTLITANFTNSSDANFRAWVASMIAAIVAGGWVQTADTGQINTATVTAPAVVNTSQGYAIFRSNDAGGSLVDFYIKVEFGSGAVSALRPSVWITVGWATDGAGNLVSVTFPISTRTQVPTALNPSGSSVNINQAAGSGYICIGEFAGSGENLWFSVERTRDSAGASQNQILIILLTGTWANTVTQALSRTNAFPTQTGVNIGINVSVPPDANTPIAGIVGLGILFGFSPGPTSPSLNVFFVESSALGAVQDIVTLTVNGGSHNYRIVTGTTLAGLGTGSMLVRFE